MIIFASKQQGKTVTAMIAIQQAMVQGKEIIVATSDHAATIRRLRYYLPKAWFVIENGWIRIVGK